MYSRRREDQNLKLAKQTDSVYAFSKSLLNACVPGTILGSQDTIVNKIYAVVILMEWYVSGGYRKKK